ncbi:MAG: hypothetical protein HYZ65_02965 [Burkholderiales bacterium]|nr:hypothetical protein [Burkholderiales bacterium]
MKNERFESTKKETQRILNRTLAAELTQEDIEQVAGGIMVPNPTNEAACDKRLDIWVY